MILIREAVETDMPFVYSSWLKSAREEFMNIPKERFYPMFKHSVKEIIAKSKVIVACDPDLPDHLFGYMVFKKFDDAFILHWAYVKQNFRKHGVFDHMVKSELKDTMPAAFVTTQSYIVAPYKHPDPKAHPSNSISEETAKHKTQRRVHIFEKYKMIYKPEYRGI